MQQQTSRKKPKKQLGPTARAFVAEVEAFCVSRSLQPAEFGKEFAGDTAFLHRLKHGMSIGVDRMDKVREKMAAYRPAKVKG